MDMDSFKDTMESIAKVFKVLYDISKFLNSNVFSNVPKLVDGLKKAIDFISGLFAEGGFLSGLFSGDGFSLGSIGDMFGGLFG